MLQDLKARFCRYVQIDTESDPASSTVPSTEKQKNLSRLLVEELIEMGISDAEMDEFGYVYATLLGNCGSDAPIICYCSHVDTSPDCSGFGVKPMVHENWQGQDLVLPDDTSIVLRKLEHPDLAAQIGNDIITASGKTLLGADNKAGIAAIMATVQHFMQHPELPRCTLRILFTPDEEIGRGVDKVNLTKLGAHFGYTVDGESLGSFENETFSADAMTIRIYGVPSHPGYALGKMQHAIKIAGQILSALPKKMSAEGTTGRKGFVHPTGIKGSLDVAELSFIIRDFDTAQLAVKEQMLKDITNKILLKFPGASATFEIKEQYRNMYEILKDQPKLTALAKEALLLSGLKPKIGAIRGGTDGSRLTFMGLPCPNIFAGEHAFHSVYEWVSLQDMAKSAETLVHLAGLWSKEKV